MKKIVEKLVLKLDEYKLSYRSKVENNEEY